MVIFLADKVIERLGVTGILRAYALRIAVVYPAALASTSPG
jgi:hypothetical protein